MQSLRTLARTVAQNFWLPAPDEWPPVLVVSPGGVGTTFLMRHINRFVASNDIDDQDHLKHLPRPPDGLRGKDVAVIFVTGDKKTITASLKRRGFLDYHCCKLGAVRALLAKGETKDRLFVKAVEEQERRWANNGPPRFFLLHHDKIWDNVDKLAEFLKIDDPRFVEEFPPRKARKSSQEISSSESGLV